MILVEKLNFSAVETNCSAVTDAWSLIVACCQSVSKVTGFHKTDRTTT